MGATETVPVRRRHLDKARVEDISDWLVVAIAASLPWSTSATGILIVLWLLLYLLVVDFGELLRSLRRPAVALPVALCGLAAVGLLWSVAPVRETFGGLTSFVKLLLIPLLIVQFSRNDRGFKVVGAFLLSCTAVMLLSWALTLLPVLPSIEPGRRGVPVKEVIVQSTEFSLCVFALAHLALDASRVGRKPLALSLAAWAALFLANMIFVDASRTSVVLFFPLVLVFALQRFSAKGVIAGAVLACVVAAAAASLSPHLRYRVANLVREVKDYEAGGAFVATSAGVRLEFWKKSVRVMADAPFIGHGTGSIEEMFRRDAIGHAGISAIVTNNPHNQTFNIGIQLGLVGIAMLYAMWIAHALLFCRAGLPASLGLAVVLQNALSSLTNSQLFYYVPGWIYVFGVGVLGGMVLRELRQGRLSSSVGAQ